MEFQLGRILITCEPGYRFAWRPWGKMHAQRDSLLQREWDYVWYGQLIWLWLEITVTLLAGPNQGVIG